MIKHSTVQAIQRIGACVLLCASISAHATEGGGDNIPNGAEDFMSGALPPPGTYALIYMNHYSANRFNDGNGNSVLPHFKVRADAVAVRIAHMTDTKLWGGQVGIQGIGVLADVSASVLNLSDSRSGVGDLTVGPVLAWHFTDWHMAGAVDFVLPTGEYDKTRLVNLGRNYRTVRPAFSASYLPKSGLDISVKADYALYNSTNKDTNYRSGNAFRFDYAVGQQVSQNVKLGIGGYYYKQMTDDEIGGVRAGPDGNRGRVFAIGPALRYQSGRVTVTGKIQQELMARNRPEGASVWVDLITAF